MEGALSIGQDSLEFGIDVRRIFGQFQVGSLAKSVDHQDLATGLLNTIVVTHEINA